MIEVFFHPGKLRYFFSFLLTVVFFSYPIIPIEVKSKVKRNHPPLIHWDIFRRVQELSAFHCSNTLGRIS